MTENALPNQNLIKKNKSSHKYYTKSILAVFAFLILIFIELYQNGSYLDEIIGLGSAIYLIFFRSKLERRDMITVIFLYFVVVIGLLSNLIFNLNSSLFSICIDVVAETKLLFAYFAMKYTLSNEEKQATIDMLLPVAKLYTVFAFICSIISLFVNIGMSGAERYGLGTFKFIFTFSFQYIAVYMLIFGILVCNSKMKDKERIWYYVIGLISIFLALKAPPIMFTIIFVGLAFYFKKHDRLSLPVIIVGAIAIVIAGQFQINEYLLNENAPRRIFFEYSFKTANTYFPLGSGFATYASDQAARNYSVLYYQYGFDELNGMSPENGAFLSDTFWPMAIGQFGWIGAILYLIVYIRIFMTFGNSQFNSQKRAFLYAAYLQYMIHAIGSAILSSSAGLIGFMALALFSVVGEEDAERKKKSGLRIRF